MNNIISILSKIMTQDRDSSIEIIEQILIDERYKEDFKESLESFIAKDDLDKKDKLASESLHSIVNKYR